MPVLAPPWRGLALKQGADCSVDIPHPLGIFGRVGEGVTTSNSHTTKEVRPSPPPIPLPCAGGGLGAKPSSRDAPPLPARWAIGFMLLGCGWGAEGSQVPVPPPEGAPGSRGLWVGRGGVARLRACRAAGRQAIFILFLLLFFFSVYSQALSDVIETEEPSEHSLVKRQIDERRVVCYYANWAVYRYDFLRNRKSQKHCFFF